MRIKVVLMLIDWSLVTPTYKVGLALAIIYTANIFSYIRKIPDEPE